MTSTNQVTGLVLAAGASVRLGQPKQLVEYQGQPLVARAVEETTVVWLLFRHHRSWRNADLIVPAIRSLQTTIVINKEWKLGIGNSISYAMQHMDSAEAALICLCDQPLIETNHYQKLVQVILSGRHSIAATDYSSNQHGVPAAFDKAHFGELKLLAGDVGARRIIQANAHVALKVSGQILDIDTRKDLETLGITRQD